MYLQGYEVDGYAMVMGWGKPVRVNANPVTRAAVVSRSGYATSFAAPVPQLPVPSMDSFMSAGRSKWDLAPATTTLTANTVAVSLHTMLGAACASDALPGNIIPIRIPTNPTVRDAIDLLARFVATDGEEFEKVLCSSPSHWINDADRMMTLTDDTGA
jgi:hypothetical protein